MSLYRGVSFTNYNDTKELALTDTQLIQRDLINHLMTARGERVMMPTFGTIIPDLPFEPLDDRTIELATNDVIEVIKYDPRVQLQDITATPDYDFHTLTVSATILYVELGVSETLDFTLSFSDADFG